MVATIPPSNAGRSRGPLNTRELFSQGRAAMSSLFDTPIRMAREMRQRYFSDDCSPMSAFAGIFRDYHIELQYESHGDSLRREGETYIITLPRNTSPERDV